MKFLFYIALLLCTPIYAQQDNTFTTIELPNLIPYQMKGKFGYCTPNKELRIKCTFDMAYPFNRDADVQYSVDESIRKFGNENYATVVVKNKKYRIDNTGKIVCTIKDALYDLASYGSVYKIYESNNLKGIKDTNDSILIEARYEEIYPITHLKESKPFIAKWNGKYGLVDIDKVLVDFNYAKIEYPFLFPTSICPVSAGRKR